MNKNKTIIGRLESIALPDLAIDDLQVRVDTGAKPLHYMLITSQK